MNHPANKNTGLRIPCMDASKNQKPQGERTRLRLDASKETNQIRRCYFPPAGGALNWTVVGKVVVVIGFLRLLSKNWTNLLVFYMCGCCVSST